MLPRRRDPYVIKLIKPRSRYTSDCRPMLKDQMNRQQCWYFIRADLFQATGESDVKTLISRLMSSPSTRFLVAFRVATWARTRGTRSFHYLVARWLHKRWSIRCNVEIPITTVVGPGLVLNHFIGGIVVSQHAVIGKRVRLNPGVLVGTKPSGAPTIGDDVRLTNGAKVIGPVTVGDRALVGVGSVVTHDVPAGAVVAGVPARILHQMPIESTLSLDFERQLGPLPG